MGPLILKPNAMMKLSQIFRYLKVFLIQGNDIGNISDVCLLIH